MSEEGLLHVSTDLRRLEVQKPLARKMAGKCNFLTGRLFGKVGRAPLKALYARANSSSCQLDKPTRSSLLALRDIILHCRPMTIPRVPCAARYSRDLHRCLLQSRRTSVQAGRRGHPEVGVTERHTDAPPFVSTKVTYKVRILPGQVPYRAGQDLFLRPSVHLSPRVLGVNPGPVDFRTLVGPLLRAVL